MIEKNRQRVSAWIGEHLQEILTSLKELVAIESVSSSEACQRALDMMIYLGDENNMRLKCRHDDYAVLSMGDGEKALGLAVHLDVVPAGNGWLYPPFQVSKIGDYLVGRGINDNKGSAIMAFYAMRCLSELGLPLRHTLELVMGTCEETGMEDIKHYVQNESMPEWTLVPDGDYPVCFGQKGRFFANIRLPRGPVVFAQAAPAANMLAEKAVVILEHAKLSVVLEAAAASVDGKITVQGCEQGIRIQADGRAGHAADPESGVNALRVLVSFLRTLKMDWGEWGKTLDAIALMVCEEYGSTYGLKAEDEVFGRMTTVSSCCDVCGDELEISVDARYPQCVSGQTVTDQIDAFCSYFQLRLCDVGINEPYLLDKNMLIIRQLMRVYRAHTGDMREPYTMCGGTYARVIPNSVTFGITMPNASTDMRRYLPTEHGEAHQCDETLHIPSYRKSMEIFIDAILAVDAL
ncbi:MAG: Sapep family Mn(2+)-dependent dipeptidase [Clostridia bacterium]